MNNFISLGGQHQGKTKWLFIRFLKDLLFYQAFLGCHVVQQLMLKLAISFVDCWIMEHISSKNKNKNTWSKYKPKFCHSKATTIDFFINRWVQNLLVQATYWHNPLKEAAYRSGSTFLAEINNELTVNQIYVDNLKKLNKWVKCKFYKQFTLIQSYIWGFHFEFASDLF